MNSKSNLMICGFGRHGKDTVAAILAKELGVPAQCSSHLASRHVIAPQLDKLFDKDYIDRVARIDGAGSSWLHPDIIESNLYNTRHEGDGRKIWFDAICEYNKEDPTRLMRKLYEVSGIYVGCRSMREFVAGKDECFQLSIWVDASGRLEPELGTCEIRSDDCDIVIHNNGTLDSLTAKVKRLSSILKRGMLSE